ncbi:hypothetical protein ACN38_g4154 [Penicillium nordicum]|uniref:Uncharacterized protein n=1 Tax=Penicillium nordicum TaxID=229535 RepID=A0A0M8P4F6_9EURO|nr:hypothetical protein ACN38_g4154 [Penicillium nordicum]
MEQLRFSRFYIILSNPPEYLCFRIHLAFPNHIRSRPGRLALFGPESIVCAPSSLCAPGIPPGQLQFEISLVHYESGQLQHHPVHFIIGRFPSPQLQNIQIRASEPKEETHWL